MEIKDMQKRVYANKVAHDFNVTDINFEFLLMYGEVAEAYEAYLKKDRSDVAEELADVAIYLLGLAEILEIDLGSEIEKKMAINEKRIYTDKGRIDPE